MQTPAITEVNPNDNGSVNDGNLVPDVDLPAEPVSALLPLLLIGGLLITLYLQLKQSRSNQSLAVVQGRLDGRPESPADLFH